MLTSVQSAIWELRQSKRTPALRAGGTTSGTTGGTTGGTVWRTRQAVALEEPTPRRASRAAAAADLCNVRARALRKQRAPAGLGLIVLALAWLASGLAAATQDKPAPPPGAPPQGDATRKPATLAAVVKTARGDVRLELFADKTPLAAANFVNLALRGFYDGLTFDRIIAKTAVEGGCPLGKGIGFPGYKFEDEFDPKLRHDAAGVVSLLGAGPNTNGCRFTITLRAMPTMDDRNTIFGKVTSGMDAVRKLEPGDKIESVRIEGDPAPLLTRMKARLAEWNKALDEKFPRLKPAPVVAPPTEAKPGG